MRQRQRFISVFIIFLVLSILIIGIFQTPVGNSLQGVFEIITAPLQKITHTTLAGSLTVDADKELQNLREENKKLMAALVKQEDAKKEMAALRDQFSTTTIPAKELLPATIIGSRNAILGAVEPTEIILDKGKRQKVFPGDAVVYKDMLVGQVVRVSENRAVVRLPLHSGSSISAKTIKTNALGIMKGQSTGVILDNVLLSDSLEVRDIVVTKGDIDEEGKGYPPGLIIGKISAVHKKASALFQSAEIEAVLSVNRLTTVFIHRRNE